MNEPKTITRDTYLKALAMFTMGNQLYVQAHELQLKMDELLDYGDSRVTDAFYGERASVRDFDVALKEIGIAVEPEVAALPNGNHGGAT